MSKLNLWLIIAVTSCGSGIVNAQETIGEVLEYDESNHQLAEIRMSHYFDGYREGVLSLLGMTVAHLGHSEAEGFQLVVDCFWKEDPDKTFARLIDDARENPETRLRDWTIKNVLWKCTDEIEQMHRNVEERILATRLEPTSKD